MKATELKELLKEDKYKDMTAGCFAKETKFNIDVWADSFNKVIDDFYDIPAFLRRDFMPTSVTMYTNRDK